ncbi:MAG: SpoIIE family protein phosphatase [Bacteroidales bacterium]|nr:SpoIIE family protein phosphatase [Bacteroidales bacterium]
MKKYRHSFASKLGIQTALLSSLLFLGAVLVIGYEAGTMMEKRAVDYAHQSLQIAIGEVQSILSNAEDQATSSAISLEEHYRSGKIIDTTRCYRLLERVIEDDSSIIGAGFFFAPYKYVRGSRFAGIYVSRYKGVGQFVHEWDDDESYAVDGYNYLRADWYSNVEKSGKPGWKSPFFETMETYYQMLTTYSVPLVEENGDFIGVFAADISLDWLKEKLISLKPYPRSNVVLVDSSLSVICNPIAEDQFARSIYDTPIIPGSSYTASSDFSREEFKAMVNGGEPIRLSKGLKTNNIITERMDNGWILCVTLPIVDVFSDLLRMWHQLLILAAIVIPLIYFLNKRKIKKISRPIEEFANAASTITDGRFDVPIPLFKTKDELEDLGNALSYMQKSVTKYIAELETTTAEKARLGSELSVASKIQNEMLCRDFPQMKRGGIFADSIPAKEVGGDLYDFFINGKDLYFILGDVSGKGVPAALLMAITIAAFRSAGKTDQPVEQIVSLINNTFCKSNNDLMFVTLVVGKIDTVTGRMAVCNAGHNPIMTVRPDGTSEFLKTKTNVACGVMPDFPYEGDAFDLPEGVRLVIYSDGITEAENSDKDQYGETRLAEWAGAFGYGRKKEEDVVGSLLSSVRGFTAGAEQNDDMTILSISF